MFITICIIHNGKGTGMAKSPIKRREANENVAYVHNDILFGHKEKNKLMKFSGKWMDLEREVT